jgi:hypothetical protein
VRIHAALILADAGRLVSVETAGSAACLDESETQPQLLRKPSVASKSEGLILDLFSQIVSIRRVHFNMAGDSGGEFEPGFFFIYQYDVIKQVCELLELYSHSTYSQGPHKGTKRWMVKPENSEDQPIIVSAHRVAVVEAYALGVQDVDHEEWSIPLSEVNRNDLAAARSRRWVSKLRLSMIKVKF